MGKIESALQKTTDTKQLFLSNGAVNSAAEMFISLFPGKKAIIVADTNTWKAAGEAVYKSIAAAGIVMDPPFVFDDENLYAEESYLEQLRSRLSECDAIPVAVGSGVINDLTKYSSHLLGRRYICVGTAVSMDGYTAFGASITFDGNKQTVECPAPLGFVMDPEVAAKAPKELAASGYADLIAKIPAGADWMLSDAIGSEKIDRFSFDLVQDGLKEALDDPEAVHAGDVEKTAALAEGLLMSGFAMQAIQSSRPASGTEHQFSHFWDMENLCFEGKHVSHGFKVAVGTLVSTALLEYLIDTDVEGLNIEACVDAWKSWDETEADIRRIFTGKPGHLARALKESADKYVDKDGLRKQLLALKESWPVLKDRIKDQIIPFAEVREKLKLVGAPYEPEMIGVSRQKLHDTLLCIPYMRSRITGIDILFRLGLLEDFSSRIFGPEGPWTI